MQWLLTLVRSQGQIFFQRGVLVGTLVLAGLVVGSPSVAAAALIGAAVQSGVAYVVRVGTRHGRPGARPSRIRRILRAGADGALRVEFNELHTSGAEELVAREAPGRTVTARHAAPDPVRSPEPSRAVLRHDVRDGIHGFCGALTGCAAVAACGPTVVALIWTLLGAAVCALVIRAVDAFAPLAGFPLLTAPFCLVNSVFAVLFTVFFAGFAAPAATSPWVPGLFRAAGDGPLLAGGHELAAAWSSNPLHTIADAAAGLALGTVRSAGQAVLVEHTGAGVLVLLALFVAGRKVGGWAVLGAFVGTAVAALAGNASAAAHGVAGYNGLLLGIALGTVFPLRAARWWRITLTALAAALSVPTLALLQHVHLAAYTWPFVLLTWVTLALRSLARARHPVV